MISPASRVWILLLDDLSSVIFRQPTVASKGFTVHSRRPYSRQDQAQSISIDYQSNHEKYEFNHSPKYFKIRPSQPLNIENFGGGSVGCQKITEDKSSKNRVQAPNTGLIIATTTTPRRKGRNPRLSLTAVASLQYQDTRVETHVSTFSQRPRRRA